MMLIYPTRQTKIVYLSSPLPITVSTISNGRLTICSPPSIYRCFLGPLPLLFLATFLERYLFVGWPLNSGHLSIHQLDHHSKYSRYHDVKVVSPANAIYATPLFVPSPLNLVHTAYPLRSYHSHLPSFFLAFTDDGLVPFDPFHSLSHSRASLCRIFDR